MRFTAALLAVAAASAVKLRTKTPISTQRAVQKPSKVGDGPWAGVLAFTRFNCAFPFCPTTALDVCTADEHYENGRPNVIATLIPQTETAQMNFYAYSDFDATTRLHYTLAARQEQTTNQPLNQLFTTWINATGTGGALVNATVVDFPANASQSDIVYLNTYQGSVWVTFATGTVVEYNPVTGALLSTTGIVADPDMQLTLATTFDPSTGTLYSNAIRASEGSNLTDYFLVSYNVNSGAVKALGPLPPAPGSAGPSGFREDAAISSLIVQTPSNGTQIMEMRSSANDPFNWMSWLNPATGASQTMPLPDDWYLDWEVDPQIFPGNWPGSVRKVWSYDPVNQLAWFKLYDECGGESDDCDEDEAIVYLEWVPPAYVDWYVAVEPVEPQMTEMLWVNSSQIERRRM